MSLILVIVGLLLVLLAAVALWLALRLHWFHHPAAADVKPTDTKDPALPAISGPTVAELEAQLKLAYEAQINQASQKFGTDLKETSTKLTEQATNLTTKVIDEELAKYQQTLEEVRKVATETMEQIHQAVENQRVELRYNMEAEVEAERKRLVEKFDTKMGDIVASYVQESLGGGVDLGTQLQFITNSLEANKEAIKKDILG